MPAPKAPEDTQGTMADAPSLLLVTEAANRIGICSATAYRWLHAGLLPGTVQVGKRWRIRTSVLDQWLGGQHSGAFKDNLPARPAIPDAYLHWRNRLGFNR